MRLAAVPRHIGYCGAAAQFARCSDGEGCGHGWRAGVLVSPDVLAAYFVGCADGNEGRGSGGLFDVGTSPGFFALDQAHCAGDLESEIAGGFDGLDGGGSGGANIVDDYYARPFFAEAFDALSGAVLLFGFADQKTVQVSADYRNRRDDGIGAHG